MAAADQVLSHTVHVWYLFSDRIPNIPHGQHVHEGQPSVKVSIALGPASRLPKNTQKIRLLVDKEKTRWQMAPTCENVTFLGWWVSENVTSNRLEIKLGHLESPGDGRQRYECGWVVFFENDQRLWQKTSLTWHVFCFPISWLVNLHPPPPTYHPPRN